MNRIIKFRGKSIKTGEWIYGLPVMAINGTYVVSKTPDNGVIRLDESDLVYDASLGQCTNIRDNKGNDIYEGDILEYYNHKYVVDFDNSSFRLSAYGKKNDFLQQITCGMPLGELLEVGLYYQVVGNMFDTLIEKIEGHE